MKKIAKALVTGGAGFIGSHIVDELLRRRIETFVIDNLSTGSLENLAHHKGDDLLHIMVGDVRNIEGLLDGIADIDVVFHEAAIANVLRSISEPMVVHDANVNMTLGLMNFCVKNKIRRFVFASSGAVYGVIDRVASEEMVCRPYSPYGASKLAVEDYLSAYYQTYGLETVALRYLNVYGPRQVQNDYSGVITIFTGQLLNNQVPTIYGDGLQTRDFVHVKDIVEANMLSMVSDQAVGDVFNVATQNSPTILELLATLKSITKKEDISPRFAPPRPGDVKFGFASIRKARRIIGFEPKFTIAKGLDDVVEYFRSRSPVKMVKR